MTDTDMTDSMPMWEILVPTVRNEGAPFRTRYHRVWDEKVKEISGGLTIVSPVKGTWISEEGEEFKERMIPVRIRCSREDMFKIANMTKKYYDQLAVMVIKISDETFII